MAEQPVDRKDEPHPPFSRFGTGVLTVPQDVLAGQLQPSPAQACPANRLPRPLDGLALKMEPGPQRKEGELGRLGASTTRPIPAFVHEPQSTVDTHSRLPTPPPKPSKSILIVERQTHGPTILCGSAVRDALPASHRTRRRC